MSGEHTSHDDGLWEIAAFHVDSLMVFALAESLTGAEASERVCWR